VVALSRGQCFRDSGGLVQLLVWVHLMIIRLVNALDLNQSLHVSGQI
jgi:hypothetical protein